MRFPQLLLKLMNSLKVAFFIMCISRMLNYQHSFLIFRFKDRSNKFWKQYNYLMKNE